MDSRIAWGILSTGRIAKAFATGVMASKTGRLVAVGSRTQPAADQFGAEFNIPHRHGSYEALLADPDVQAVYIAPPHPYHAEWAIKAAEAGKHILCEKPLTLNHADAMAVIDAAERNNVFLMEAFMYRGHPQTLKLVELLRQKVIGEVRIIQATFSFDAGWNPEGRLFKNALGGGGILDVGCYCTSMARLVAGVAMGKDFADPIALTGAGRLTETGVDAYAVATLRFPGDILAQIATGVQLNQESVVRIFGTEGNILVPSPWICSRQAGTSKIVVRRYKEPEPQEVVVESDRDLYAIEADTVAACIPKRQAPTMSWADTLGNMRTLDLWRAAVGVIYDAEKPEGQKRRVDGRPLRREPDAAKMPYQRIAGLDKPVSRLLLGAMAMSSLPYAAMLYDEFFARGGNGFDTAYVYGGGQSERLLGQWVKLRGIRDEVVILAKGAHTPFCTPQWLTAQFMESLDRLQMDYVDIYMMHRDNPDVPAGEFIDVMNEHQKAGRMRTFGVSNWPLERVRKANAYARRKGLNGIAAVSNHLSLARMVDPVWGGCLTAADAESRKWFARAQLPLLAWSSQSRGFFVHGNPNDRSNDEITRCWYADDNFERLERARALARERGVEPINIALAYVLHQPFAIFALIGPLTLAEIRSSLHGLDVELTPREMRWLNLEAATRK